MQFSNFDKLPLKNVESYIATCNSAVKSQFKWLSKVPYIVKVNERLPDKGSQESAHYVRVDYIHNYTLNRVSLYKDYFATEYDIRDIHESDYYTEDYDIRKGYRILWSSPAICFRYHYFVRNKDNYSNVRLITTKCYNETVIEVRYVLKGMEYKILFGPGVYTVHSKLVA